jgi:hypothetical protein
MNKKLVIVGVASALSLATAPAMAWGDREQGILIGMVGGHILSQIHRNSVGYTSPGVVYRDSSAPGRGWGQSYGYNSYPRVGSTVVVREIVREPTVVYRAPPTVITSPRVCREVPVRDESGSIIEFRQLCE